MTNEQLAKFFGGDFEVRDYEGRLLGGTGGIERGPIESAEVNGIGLSVHLHWAARNQTFDAYSPADTWVISSLRTKSGTSLDVFAVCLDTFTEEPNLAEPGHVRLNSPIHGLVLIFHPPGDNLKPSQVAGHPGAPPT
ncbi:hypothetical protein KKD80_03365 [Patescibacteria group bacterium]|nr:hypothetical protein [Patescibacteria group bacterium]